MTTILLIINVFVTIALIGVILIQRSEGGGLGIGSGQGMGALMSGRGTANLLTRATAVLATIFMVLCLALAYLNQGASNRQAEGSILTQPVQTAPAQGASPLSAPQPEAPHTP